MAKTAAEYEKDFIAELKNSSGKDLAGWMKEIDGSGHSKRNDIIGWLKTEHGFGHTNAGLLVTLHANGGKPVYGDMDSLLENLFVKKEDMRPLYETLKGEIQKEVKDAKFTPLKTYMSVLDKREFAVVAVKNGELRLGLDLGDEPTNEYLVPAKTLGAMPRYTHMVVLKSNEDLKGNWKEYLKKSYGRVHK